MITEALKKLGFVDALRFVLIAEGSMFENGTIRNNGGYTNDPADPGGETKWGISKKAHPSLDIYNLTLEAASEIYKHDYWDKTVPDDCQWPLNLYAFDCAVNQGIHRATGFLLSCENDPERFLEFREQFYKNTKPELFAKYGKGWLNRVNAVREYGKKMMAEA